jgi:adenylylsulfate kinase
MKPAFAVWITGLPASGKSTVAAALAWELTSRGLEPALLESDGLRRILTPRPRFDEEEREAFYGTMSWFGSLLVAHGVPVLFDATAHRRGYRDRARESIDRFVEVYVDTPLEVCERRDPKGIYRAGREGRAGEVPGLQVRYEPPARPDLVVHGDREPAAEAARRIAAFLERKGFLPIPVEDPQ